MSADPSQKRRQPPELVPDGREGEEELWDSSSSSEEDSDSVPIGTRTVTKRASPLIESSFHCFSLMVYIGIKTYESTVFKSIPEKELRDTFSIWYTFGGRWKFLTFINVVSAPSRGVQDTTTQFYFYFLKLNILVKTPLLESQSTRSDIYQLIPSLIQLMVITVYILL